MTRRWLFGDQLGPYILDGADRPVLLVEAHRDFRAPRVPPGERAAGALRDAPPGSRTRGPVRLGARGQQCAVSYGEGLDLQGEPLGHRAADIARSLLRFVEGHGDIKVPSRGSAPPPPELLTGDEQIVWQQYAGQKVNFKSLANQLRFQLGQRDRFVTGICFSGRYFDVMNEVFNEYNLPKELLRLAFVESSFNVNARSRVGASGIWQIMRSTGRLYMKVNSAIDERNHPLIATRAAAKIFRSNYESLQSWPLAVLAYNFGQAGVKRLTAIHNTKEITDLIGKVNYRRFGFASQNFYAAFLAALKVEKDANQYFGEVKWAEPFKYVSVQMSYAMPFKGILNWFDQNIDKAAMLNPHLTRRVKQGWHFIPAGTWIYVPENKKEMALNDLANKNLEPQSLSAPEASGLTGSGFVYKIAQGDTLSDIAMWYNVKISDLIANNDIGNPRRLRVGQEINIPQ